MKKSKVYCTDGEKHQKFSQEEFYLCRCSTTSLVERKTMKKNVWHTLDSYLCMQEDLEQDNSHSVVLVLGKKWYSIKEECPQSEWDKIAEKMLSEFAESGCPIFRATTPLSRNQLKSKRHGKLSIHFAAVQETIETIFRIIVSVSQRYVKSMNPFTRERSDPLWWDNQVQDFWVLLRMDSISWRKTLEISLNLIQWPVVNTLFQEKKQHHNRKAGSEETLKLGPYWKLQPVICTANMELRSELSLSRHNTHFWVTISNGSNKFVMNLNNNETEIPEDQLEEYALKLGAKDFACRTKAKTKPQRREPACSSPRIVPMERRNWIDIEPKKYSPLSEYEVSKKVIYLLRHSQQVHREEDGAVHFWRMKIFRINSHNRFIGLTNDGNHVWQQKEK